MSARWLLFLRAHAVLVKLSIWICSALSLKKQTRILQSISRIKKIWEQGEYYRSFQGKYPVIFITLKDVKHNSWDNTFANIGSIISSEYCRHSDLSKSPKLDKKQKDFYDKMVSEKFSAVDLERSLLYLSEMLKKHHGEGAVIIIDEYDTPIQSGHYKRFLR